MIAPPQGSAGMGAAGRKRGVRRHLAALPADASWEFLRHFWPTSSSGGRAIDLYDDAYFEGPMLSPLRAGLLRATLTARARQPEWRELLGTRLKPKVETLYGSVRRDALLALIATLLAGIDEAERCAGRIAFEGD
jgi:hypothetical protein